MQEDSTIKYGMRRLMREGMQIEAIRIDDNHVWYHWLRHPDVGKVHSCCDKYTESPMTDDQLYETSRDMIDAEWEKLKDRFGADPKAWAAYGNNMLAAISAKLHILEDRLMALNDKQSKMDNVDKLSIVCALDRLFNLITEFEQRVMCATLLRLGNKDGDE